MKQRLLNILFWSVISAAFIGPGTITTAASAGASFGYTLLWALLFSTVACIVLQEASSRLTTVSGLNLGQAIRAYLFHKFWGRIAAYLALTAIILGCVAYEAGNILGAVAGASLIWDIPSHWLTLTIGVLAFVLFWAGSVHLIARVMGLVVAFMGVCFLTTAFIIQPSLSDLFTGALVPRFPPESGMLILALIGTTVVPYNIFLGSGIVSDQSLSEMRWSLGIAIVLGGIISMAVLVVGASITSTFTFEALARELARSLGGWAATFLGLGLFAAGFSSAVTAPLAAAITAQSVLQHRVDPQKWNEESRNYRMVWGGVLLTGLIFGAINIRPIPAIILAQALNGIILPLVAIFLLLMMNNRQLLNRETVNSTLLNIMMGLVVFITVIIGTTNVFRALTNAFSIPMPGGNILFGSSVFFALLIGWPVYRLTQRLRNG